MCWGFHIRVSIVGMCCMGVSHQGECNSTVGMYVLGVS